MRYFEDRFTGLTVAYIGGGSRGWAWGFMKDLARDGQMEGVVRLYDIDRDAAEKNAAIGAMVSAHPDAKARWRYEVADSLREALIGADFVVISILPGTFSEMRSDVHCPEKVGVYQPVGDTVGPGGLLRALRTVPMYVEIAGAIRDFAPDAWVINYTNPMSVCVRTLYAVFPGVKAFGCCHEVFGTQKLLAAMVSETLGIPEVDREDIKTGVTGINHFTWIYSASYKGYDLFPMYRAFADKYYETGYRRGVDNALAGSPFECTHRVKFDLFRRYGLIAAAGDRHLAEFMPPWYLKNPETAHAWGFSLTHCDWRDRNLQERLAQRARILSGEEPITLRSSGEEGHLQLKALLGLGEMVTNINIPNRGQVENLPLGAVVETNALLRRDEIQPVHAGALPKGIDALVTRHALAQEATVRAAMTCDRTLALATFLGDPQMANVSPADGERLFEQMVENTKQ